MFFSVQQFKYLSNELKLEQFYSSSSSEKIFFQVRVRQNDRVLSSSSSSSQPCCQPLKCAPNSNIIAQAVDDAVRNLGINRSFFCLLLSDAAKYVIAAGITLKSLYPKLFHVTCVAHLLHSCAIKIESHFENVDQLIANVKAVTIKNKTGQAKFSAIGYPPQPVPTRWGSWLNAVLLYAKKLPEVKAIVESFVGSGILVTHAKVSLQKSGLAGQLLKIKDEYECLVNL